MRFKLVHFNGKTVVLALDGGSEEAIFGNIRSAQWWKDRLTKQFTTSISIQQY